jgi:hypothetical protein
VHKLRSVDQCVTLRIACYSGTLVPTTRTKRGLGMLRKILLVCGVVSLVLYVVVDMLGTVRYPGYRYTEQQFSGLTASGSPVRPLMIALSVIPYTLLVAAFAVGVWVSALHKRAGTITAAMLLGCAAFGMPGGWLTPMSTREALAAGEGCATPCTSP